MKMRKRVMVVNGVAYLLGMPELLLREALSLQASPINHGTLEELQPAWSIRRSLMPPNGLKQY